MNPHLSASFKIALSTFIGGVVGALQPYFATGVFPAQAQWHSIESCAILAGIVALVHLYQLSPNTVASQQKALAAATAVNAAVASGAVIPTDLVAVVTAPEAAAKTDPAPPVIPPPPPATP